MVPFESASASTHGKKCLRSTTQNSVAQAALQKAHQCVHLLRVGATFHDSNYFVSNTKNRLSTLLLLCLNRPLLIGMQLNERSGLRK
jgi:hypothetical protein